MKFALLCFLGLMAARASAGNGPTAHVSEAMEMQQKYRDFLSRVAHDKSDPQHSPTFLFHARGTKRVALVIPGSFESPAHFRTMANYFYRTKGINTLSVSLPGFWTKDLKDVTSVQYAQWVEYLEHTMSFLSQIGDEVVIYGHSLGGLLAIYLASRYPDTVKMVFTSSPAISTTGIIKVLSSMDQLGAKVGIKLNGKLPRANGVDVPLQSGNISSQITKFAEAKGIWPATEDFLAKYKTPTFAISPANDLVVSTKKVKAFFAKLSSPKKIIILDKKKGVTHRSMMKAKIDLCLNIKEVCWKEFDLEAAFKEVDAFYNLHGG